MPEKGVVRLNEREIHWEERQQPVSVNREDDDLFMGDFVAHSLCCADVHGGRQTFTVHVSSPADEKFVELRRPPASSETASTPAAGTNQKKKKATKADDPPFYCRSCHSSFSEDVVSNAVELAPAGWVNEPEGYEDIDANMQTADFVNHLNIRGRISAKARGKELVITICNKNTGKNFVFRIGFGLEGHCFWIPTEQYRRIVSEPTVLRGTKSQAYVIPDEYIDGPAKQRLLSLQAAFIRPEYTLLFVDHNVLITFHLMQMAPSFTSRDLRPGSVFWDDLWSRNHGPVYNQEPDAALRALDDWRLRILSKPNNLTSIYMTMKAQQDVFNGSGAQEVTDQLLLALIHPQMPALHVCAHDEVWIRFRQAFIDYDATRMALVLPEARLPYVSGDAPFRMNDSGHTKYLNQVSAYRRSIVKLSGADIEKAHELGLFVPNAVIQPDGYARVPPGIFSVTPAAPIILRADRHQKKAHVPNFAVTMAGSGGGRISYTPFTARPGPDWVSATRQKVLSDVKADVNGTTLGLYSFRVFVDSSTGRNYCEKGSSTKEAEVQHRSNREY
ncbi:hypothetical protein K438DRAFT_2018693 [Mycena galopus ATCC 62051]|nr:hypothetical protein K438DRAFT_2018693 [Mycena galopus ATCC 62051]